MTPLSVIIPSKTRSNLDVCLEALQGEDVDVLVVDDGVDWSVPGHRVTLDCTQHGKPSPHCWIVPGVKPFVFSRNVNIGIKAAGDSDVIILNDDAILKTPGGFRLLQREAQLHPEFGIIAATVDNVGNRNQWPQGVGLREDPRMVCFVCVLIPRRTIDAVGLMDERFTAYGMDDDDYSLRVRNAGLKIGIHDGCFVEHSTLRSTFRGTPGHCAKLEPGRDIFIEKWGAYPL